MIREDEVYKIGVITRTHGKTGEIQCHALNSAWEDSEADFIILKLNNIFTPFRVIDWRTKGAEDILLKIDHIDEENKALPLIGAEAYMRRADVHTDSEKAEIRWTDLVGWRIVDIDQGDLGIINAVDDSTANILIEVREDAETMPRLCPLHEDFINELDTDKRIIRVCLPFQL